VTVALNITVFNDWTNLRKTLECVALQEAAPDQIIVADDGSHGSLRDQLTDWANSRAITLTHVWHPKQGFRKCELLNKAALEVTSRFILYIDHDCLLRTGFVRSHLEFCREDMMHIGPRIHITPSSATGFRPTIPALAAAFVRKNLIGWRTAIKSARIQDKPPHRIEGCNMMIPLDRLNAINGFDNRFRAWGYGEDADIIVRGWHSGCRMGIGGPSTTVFHVWHASNATEVNRPLFEETVITRKVRCENGLNAHRDAHARREKRGCVTHVTYDY